MKVLVVSCFFILLSSFSFAQKLNPVSWDFKVSQNEDKSYTLVATAKMKGNWAVYSQHTSEGGPIPLKFTYEDGVQLIGETKEDSKPIKKMSELFEIEVIKFKKKAIFSQIFNPQKEVKSIKGTLRYMCCDSERCLPPTDVSFDVTL